jgi:hypothetical protein
MDTFTVKEAIVPRIRRVMYGRWMPAKLPEEFGGCTKWTPDMITDYESTMSKRSCGDIETEEVFSATNARLQSYPLPSPLQLSFDACLKRGTTPGIGCELSFDVWGDIFLPEVKEQTELLNLLHQIGIPALPNILFPCLSFFT